MSAESYTPSEADVDRVAEAMALVDDYDACFERVRTWEAEPDWEKEAHPDERPHSDYEDCEWWRKRARAAVEVLAAERHRVAEQCVRIAKEYAREQGRAFNAVYVEVAGILADRIRAEFPAVGGNQPPAVDGEGDAELRRVLSRVDTARAWLEALGDPKALMQKSHAILSELAPDRTSSVSDSLPLDPEPWRCTAKHDGMPCTQRAAQAWMHHRNSNIFDPRPGFSRDESRYRPERVFCNVCEEEVPLPHEASHHGVPPRYRPVDDKEGQN